jgi:S1-C subfamily serine protease
MVRTCCAIAGWLAMSVALSGCVRTETRDIDMGSNRYLVTASGSGNATVAQLEQLFADRARDVAHQHGFDSYRVSEFSSGFERTPFGPRPTARGVVYVFNGPKATANGQPGRPAGSKSSGTAFAVSRDGVLLTNAHVAASCAEISVRLSDGSTASASLLAADGANDLALIKIATPTPEQAQWRSGAEIRQGDNVIAVGYPLHQQLSAGTTLTTGTVSALAGMKNDSRELQISAPIQPGNSGGPLLDQSGNVVGVVTATMSTVVQAQKTGTIPENINFAIKNSVARSFMDANGVTYQLAPSDKPLSNAEIGDRARKFTSFVTCTS